MVRTYATSAKKVYRPVRQQKGRLGIDGDTETVLSLPH